MKKIKVALVGNPNVGKTALFNALTGSHQYVANWPGVTVEKKMGKFTWKDYEIDVIDLPGIYTLRARSIDEKVSRDYLIQERPDVVFNVVDATNLNRNLYLTIQLSEMSLKTVLILNQMDQVKNMNIKINTSELEKRLGIKVIETVATKGVNIDEIMKAALEASPAVKYEIYPTQFEELFKKMETLSKDILKNKSVPLRWLAVSFSEGDELARKILEDNNLLEEAEKLLSENEYQNASLVIARSRYNFISSILKQVEVRPKESWTISDALDHVFTHKILGIPIFISILWMMFQFAFSASTPLSDLIDLGFQALANYAHAIHGWVGSLIGDGIISGVGSVLVFVPLIFFMFFAMGVLEDTGYMSRAAFLIDRLMHKFKLSGKAFIPMILGFGCNASAIMTTRTIESEKERLISILINPFISCSARLVVYAVIAGAFFGKFAGLAIFSIYMVSIAFALTMAVVFSFLLKSKESSPLTMELPRYQLPTGRGLWIYMWSRGKHFLKKAGGIILGATVTVWFLSNMPWGANIQNSWAADIGKALAPIFVPLHFDWHITLALLFGGIAKEVTVTTLGTFAGGNLTAFLKTVLDPINAYALMLFVLIYIPCVATQAVMRMETGSYKWPILSVLWSLSSAYVIALLFETIGHLVVMI
ncbi:ferrous iron transport protein B [Mesoaciditoga sp.]